jgi:hypothetical protein
MTHPQNGTKVSKPLDIKKLRLGRSNGSGFESFVPAPPADWQQNLPKGGINF